MKSGKRKPKTKNKKQKADKTKMENSDIKPI